MSLMPYLLGDIVRDAIYRRPTRLLDQHFGLGICPDDLLEAIDVPLTRLNNYFRPWRSALAHLDQGSTIKADKDGFQVSLDVQQFAPNEVTVKTVDDYIVVEGKHEEKEDEHGYVSRQFIRRYAIPPGHDIKQVVSTLSSDGVLTVSAPKAALEDKSSERNIPITTTGPIKTVEHKKGK